jgi:RHS repeat-associated protein
MLTSTYDNGVTDTRTYNTDDTLAEIDFGGTGSAIGDLTYGWDANKNKTSETIAGVMSGYSFTVPTNGYDDEDRLVDFDGAADQVDQSWNLSLVGDWDSVTTDSTTQNRTHGPTHELLTAGGSSVTHDVKGNMTSIPANLRDSSDPLALNWDFDNRMKSADTDNDSTADVFYEFDALGRRVARDDGTQDTIFVQVGQQTIADYVSGTAAASPEYIYAWGSYIDELILRAEPAGTDLLYHHRNQQFSTYAVTDAGAAIRERYSYSPYGKPTILAPSGASRTASNEDIRYSYTGREWDPELGLYHYRARLYDPRSGRFCSKDPINYADGTNQFRYAFCNPLRYGDSLGLSGIDWTETSDTKWDITYYNRFTAFQPSSSYVYSGERCYEFVKNEEFVFEVTGFTQYIKFVSPDPRIKTDLATLFQLQQLANAAANAATAACDRFMWIGTATAVACAAAQVSCYFLPLSAPCIAATIACGIGALASILAAADCAKKSATSRASAKAVADQQNLINNANYTEKVRWVNSGKYHQSERKWSTGNFTTSLHEVPLSLCDHCR